MGLGFAEDVSQRSNGPPSCTGTSATVIPVIYIWQCDNSGCLNMWTVQLLMLVDLDPC